MRRRAASRLMLARTADSLFWTGRYVERADYLARLTDATLRLAALPGAYGGGVAAWADALAAAGAPTADPDALSERAALQFLAVDPANPSSMRACIERARTNARAVRTALTVEAWEAINGAWLEVQRFGPKLVSRTATGRLREAVQAAALGFDGATHRTMLRDEGYFFLRLGAAVERVDNTARLLGVKHRLLEPGAEAADTAARAYFEWTTVLRAVSALTAYRHVYRDSVRPMLVADMLILNRRMPRSLAASADDVVRNLDRLAGASGRRGPAHRAAAAFAARLGTARIEAVVARGLSGFVAETIADNNRLGALIAEQYSFA